MYLHVCFNHLISDFDAPLSNAANVVFKFKVMEKIIWYDKMYIALITSGHRKMSKKMFHLAAPHGTFFCRDDSLRCPLVMGVPKGYFYSVHSVIYYSLFCFVMNAYSLIKYF